MEKNYLDQLKEQILDDGGHFELSLCIIILFWKIY